MKAWLRARPDQPDTIDDLLHLLDEFRATYNNDPPHRSLPAGAIPAIAYQRTPKATPTDRTDDTHWRVRNDRVDKTGRVTLRHAGRLHHIGLGHENAGTRIVMLIADRHIRIVDHDTGELLRDLMLNPGRDYQPLGRKPGPQRQRPNPS